MKCVPLVAPSPTEHFHAFGIELVKGSLEKEVVEVLTLVWGGELHVLKQSLREDFGQPSMTSSGNTLAWCVRVEKKQEAFDCGRNQVVVLNGDLLIHARKAFHRALHPAQNTMEPTSQSCSTLPRRSSLSIIVSSERMNDVV